MQIYFDNNATTRPDDAVVEAMREMLIDHWHNPSSMHRAGQRARQRVELARQSVAKLINTLPRHIVLTSGASESISFAFRGVLQLLPPEKRTIITTAIEHEAIRDFVALMEKDASCPIQVRLLPLLEGGVVDAEALPALLDDSTALVSVQWANNETGAIQPVERLGAICREAKVLFHTDATQWVGKLPTDVSNAPIDMLSMSAHKLHGPKGSGALYIRPRLPVKPLICGSQERGRRGGTENTSGIVGMGVAAELAMQWLADPSKRDACRAQRDRFERGILDQVACASINGPVAPDARLWNTSNIAFESIEAEALLLMLSERGLAASAGSACGSGSIEPSPVLRAMGVSDERSFGSIRFSLSRETTDQEIDAALEMIPACVRTLQSSSSSAIPTVQASTKAMDHSARA